MNVEYEQKQAAAFHWSEKSMAVIKECLERKRSPNDILKKLRKGKFFERIGEPTRIQLYNKIAHMKKSIPGYVPQKIKKKRGSTGRPRLWDTDLPKPELEMLKKAKLEEKKQSL